MDGRINLQPMLPLREAIEHDDNWTGLVDARERRRRQNRLNQRAHRRRKEQSLALQVSDRPARAEVQLYFPLSLDHLLTLVQFNTYRGLLTNAKILSLPTIYSCGDPTSPLATSCASQFDPGIPPVSAHAILGQRLPPQLLPTPLQLATPHEPWIDIFPLSILRDNLLRLRGGLDSCDLCDDILGALFNGQDLDTVSKYKERNGLIIWGEPWDVRSWELMEGFVDKWGFLLEGCEVLIEGSNRWRAVRGEGPLVLGS
ncbi:hypothetical protein ASPCAL11879 [Aspergillus calidoustus]|uniref:BZIP domain-containing protein n=1 Tax=Aspergillus calidoustus TaxID=454130 RepID=A0A0U5GDK4_ASPCI|nr:hypothetical protein ASPCAL11879 [Aspergillus calidoustus]